MIAQSSELEAHSPLETVRQKAATNMAKDGQKDEQKKGKPAKGEKHAAAQEPKAGPEAPRHSAKERPRLRVRFEKEVAATLA